MELKSNKQTVIAVDYSDLEQFLQHHYGHEISIPAAMESSNGSSIEIVVNGKHFEHELLNAGNAYKDCFVPGLDEYDQEEVTKFQESGDYSYGTVSSLLDDLCFREIIEPGTYLITVYW